MKNITVLVFFMLSFMAGDLLLFSNPAAAGKYVYYNDKGEQVDCLPKKSVKKSPAKKRVKVRNRLNNGDHVRRAGVPLDTGKKKIKPEVKK